MIEEIAKSGIVEELVYKIGGNSGEYKEDLDDLIQDIWVCLLEKKEYTLDLWRKNHLKFYVARIVLNQIRSKTSPYYYKYKKLCQRVNTETLKNYTDL